ncbi:MAG: response regulator transcription factor [Gammaproteobacteria bacterium]
MSPSPSLPDPLRLLIVDDEAPARRRLRQLLAEDDRYLCVGEAADGVEALARVDELQPDVLLLDIRMPGMDGLEVARHLQQLDPPPAVIFTTAYDEFALQAFDANAVHYLVKPIRQQRLLEALQRVALVDHDSGLPANLIEEQPRTHFSIVQQDDRYLVEVGRVLYMQAEQKYVTLHGADQEWLIDESLVKLEQEFAGELIRVHRNALAWRRAVSGVGKEGEGFSLLFHQTDKRLPISRRRVAQVRKELGLR